MIPIGPASRWLALASAIGALSQASVVFARAGTDNAGRYCFIDSDESAGQGAPIYDFEDISATGTRLDLGDEDVTAALPIGFPFTYYGSAASDVFVSSNGFISFLQPSESGCCAGLPLPTDQFLAQIAGFWTDLIPPGEGGIHYQVLGAAPERRLIVQFADIPQCCLGNTPTVTWQLKLFEAKSAIELHIADGSLPSHVTSIGITDPTGTIGVQYEGPGAVSVSQRAVRFIDAMRTGDDDRDGVGDCADNCPAVANALQQDANGDGVGDACSPSIAIESVVSDADSLLATVTLDAAGGPPLSGDVRVVRGQDLHELRFVWRSTCPAAGAAFEFLLNGTSVGTSPVVTTAVCDCNPAVPFEELQIIDETTLSAWRRGEGNTLEIVQTGPGGPPFTAWMYAELNGSGAVDVPLFDAEGGDSFDEPDLCASGLSPTIGEVRHEVARFEAVVTVNYQDSQLPCRIDLGSLGEGDAYSLVVRGTNGATSASASWPLSLSGETALYINDPDADGACGAADNCPTADNPDQVDRDGDGAGDACDACPLSADDVDADGNGVCDGTPSVPVDPGEPPGPSGPAAGCSAGGGDTSGWWILGLAALGVRRRR